MTEVQKKAIKSIVTLPAWEYIVDVFKSEVIEGKKPLNFKTEGKTAEMIAMEVMAREMSAKIVDSVIKKLNRMGNETEYKKESFK